MSGPKLIQYREKRARIAVAYSTKDRTDLTRRTVAPLLDDTGLDLFWFDGSATEAGQNLPPELCVGHVGPCELHLQVTGGPDAAIIFALNTLRGRGYDFVILVENDVLLAPGWLAAMLAAVQSAGQAGFQVGAATVRVFAQRVLSANDGYCLMLNSGAGFIAFTPPAIGIVLENYRTLDGAEFLRHFWSLTGLDLSRDVEFQPSQALSADFIFDLMLYLHGYVVAAPPVSFAHMIDNVTNNALISVTTPEQHLPQTRARITKPGQIRHSAYAFYRFQKSPRSDRLFIGCHQLRVSVNGGAGPVQANGVWRRIWAQALGPFALSGMGEVHVALYGAATGLLLFAPKAGAQLLLSGPDGRRSAEFGMDAGALLDLALLETDDPYRQAACLHVISGPLYLLGLTANAFVVSEYANHHPTLEHLPV